MIETDSQRLRRYVEGFFARALRTEFPTVARCAQSLRWTQHRVEQAVEGDPDGRLMMTSHSTIPPREPGARFVESL